jgi:hypothetical protein
MHIVDSFADSIGPPPVFRGLANGRYDPRRELLNSRSDDVRGVTGTGPRPIQAAKSAPSLAMLVVVLLRPSIGIAVRHVKPSRSLLISSHSLPH